MGVLGEIAQVTGHRLGIARQGFGVAVDPPSQAYHRAIRLELGEGSLEQRPAGDHADPVHQVDSHVVAGSKRAAQRVGTRRSQPRHVRGIDARLPEHDGVAFDVDAASPGPTRQLGVLTGSQIDVGLAVEFDQPFQHHRAGRHVDSQREGLGREHRLDQPPDEQLLDGFLERGQHPGVVARDSAL